jgi:hypothetical protein
MDTGHYEYVSGGFEDKMDFFSTVAGYRLGFGRAQEVTAPDELADMVGNGSRLEGEFLVHSFDVDGTFGDAPYDHSGAYFRYVGRFPQQFGAYAELGFGQLVYQDDPGEPDGVVFWGIGASAKLGDQGEVGLKIQNVDYGNEDYAHDILIWSADATYLINVAQDRWVAVGARWKNADIDDSMIDTEVFSVFVDWYLRRNAYVGLELTGAECLADMAGYGPEPVGVLGDYTGCQIRGGYRTGSWSFSGYIEPRNHGDSQETVLGASGRMEF